MSAEVRRRVAVVTDSVANLPQALARSLRVWVVPLLVVFRDKVFRDGVDLSPAQFYRRLREGQVASTSQPNPDAFLEAYQAAVKSSASAEPAESILVITISSKLSGTFHSATQAAQRFSSAAVRVIDSLTASFAEGWLVTEAARLAERGASLGEVADRVLALREKVRIFAAVDSLDYLRRSGRIGRAVAMAGSLLKVKPILTVGRDGVAEGVDRARTLERALDRLVEFVAEDAPQLVPTARTAQATAGGRATEGSAHDAGEERGRGLQPQQVGAPESGRGPLLHAAVVHADALEAAHALRRRLIERFRCAELFLEYITPVLGAHAGPGTTGVAYWWEQEATS
ncbi:MAG: DegV family protein [Limnochordaceae bacterium]|nr:DegV family protein [Limnochordaceae bacterium]